jgi:hypothetical protein
LFPCAHIVARLRFEPGAERYNRFFSRVRSHEYFKCIAYSRI